MRRLYRGLCYAGIQAETIELVSNYLGELIVANVFAEAISLPCRLRGRRTV
jgi:hypothetical protein